MNSHDASATSVPAALTSSAGKTTATFQDRRAAIYAGMEQILEATITEHPEIRLALALRTPEIDRVNYELAAAVNNFITGRYTRRQEVRPFFDRSLALYLEIATEIVHLLREALIFALLRALEDHPSIDLSLETPDINDAALAFAEAKRRLLKGEGHSAEVAGTFYRLIAAYLDAATPLDLAEEPLP